RHVVAEVHVGEVSGRQRDCGAIWRGQSIEIIRLLESNRRYHAHGVRPSRHTGKVVETVRIRCLYGQGLSIGGLEGEGHADKPRFGSLQSTIPVQIVPDSTLNAGERLYDVLYDVDVDLSGGRRVVGIVRWREENRQR